MSPRDNRDVSPARQNSLRRPRIWVGASLVMAFFYIPNLALTGWSMPAVTASGHGITEFQSDSPIHRGLIIIVISVTLWGSVQEGPFLRHVQWIIGVVSAWGTWFWTTVKIGTIRDSTYFDCAYVNCWPVNYQEWVWVIPIMLTSLASITLGAIGPRLSLTVRRVVPVVVFATLYLLLWLIWEPMALPFFNTPPPAWSL